MKRINRSLIFVLAFYASTSLAHGRMPATTPSVVEIALDNGCLLDLPTGWIKADDALSMNAFRSRVGARIRAICHPEGSRLTDLPYAVVEEFPASRNPTHLEQDDAADAVADFYRTSLNPPSKADRASLWKRADVSAVVHDYSTRRFNFRVKIHFDQGGDYFVDVAGAFGTDGAIALSTWYDDAALAKYGDSIALLSGSLRRGGPPPSASIQEQLIYIAKVAGVILILAVAGLQAWVVWRERRERRMQSA